MRTLITVIFINILFVFAAHTAQAEQKISLKGFELGMEKKIVKKHYKTIRGKMNVFPIGYFPTLAGVKGHIQWTYEKVKIDVDGKTKKKKLIDSVQWIMCYDSVTNCQVTEYGSKLPAHPVSLHYTIVELLKKKYPLECTVSTVSNIYGKEMPEEECVYYDGHGQVLYTETYYKNSTMGQVAIYKEEDFANSLYANIVQEDDL